jgi:hypothetical protein
MNSVAERDSPTEDAATLHCKLLICRLDELRPHPSYVRNRLSVFASQLSTLAALGDLGFREPIVITRDRTIIDGYARLDLARRQGRVTILCIEYSLTEEEALRWLIQSNRPSRGLNAYRRILLAMDLEPFVRERARANQQAGGRNKGSSNLTEARQLDGRSEIAAAAGASTGNVTKVRQLMKSVHPKVEQAVRSGEISIHKAWQWSFLPAQQQIKALEEDQSRRGTNKASRRLILRHVATLSPNLIILPTLGDLLKPLVADGSQALDSICVTEIDTPGNIAYLTKDAWRILESLERRE